MRIIKPKLRFKEFQQEWERLSFTDCCDLIHGFQFRDEHFSEIGFPVVKIGNLLDTGGLTFKNVSYVPEDFKDLFERFILYPDDILMALTGGTLGKVSKVEKDYGVIFQNYRVGKFVPKKNAIKDFIYFILQSKVVQARVKSLVNEAAQPNFGKQDFDKIKVGIPTLPEQQKIASFLSTVDEKIQQLARKKELLEHYKKGVMQQLFSGKLRFKDDNGKAFPKWEKIRLGDLTFKVGKKNKENIKFPIYSINNQEGFRPQSEQFDGLDSNDRGYDISLYKIFNSKTFAYNPARINVGSIGYSRNIKEGIVSSLYVCFKTKEELEDLYLLCYLDTYNFKKDILRFEEGGVRQYLFYENFSRIKLPLPSIQEQKEITKFINEIDSRIKVVTKQITQNQTFKKGLLQQMFV
jgi:type I restriction enzyme S subunit